MYSAALHCVCVCVKLSPLPCVTIIISHLLFHASMVVLHDGGGGMVTESPALEMSEVIVPIILSRRRRMGRIRLIQLESTE